MVAISRSDSKETYATRIYAYGSDRNIASNYRKTLVFDAEVANGKLHDPARELEMRYFRSADIGTRRAKADTQCVLDIASVSALERTFSFRTNAGSDTGAQSGALHLFKPNGHGGDEYDFDMTGERKSVKSGMFEWSWLPMERPYLVLSTLRLRVTPTALSKVTDAITPKYLTAFFRLIVEYYEDDGQTKRTAYHTFIARGEWRGINNPIVFNFEDQYLTIPTEKVKRVVIENGSQIGFAIWYDESGPNYNYVNNSSQSVSVKIDAGGQIGIFEGWPEFNAAGITIEVLNKVSGEVDRTIEGAIFYADFANSQRKLTLQAGATIASGDKYQLPQLNRALVPAHYFTSIYTVFEKYQDITTNGIVNSRLLLPETDEDGNPIKGYLDAFEFESEEEAVEDVVIFEDVYPSRISKITSVKESDEYTEEQPEQDGSKTQIHYREYILTDDLFSATNPFNRGDYLIDGAALQVTFQSGLLNGMTFDVELLEDNYHFQIKRDDTTKLPNEIIKPKTGDEFILHGFNIAMISDSETDYVSNAEKELLRKTREYIAKLNTDTSTYQCTVSCDLAYEVEKDSPDGLYLGIGRSVNLIHPGYLKNGRISRVLGYEIPLDISYDNPVFFIGEKASYSRIGAIEDRLEGIGNTSGNFGAVLGGGGTAGTGAGSPYIIQQIDNTPPTDKNVYSALRARLEFVRRNVAQKLRHLWTFLAGIRVGAFVSGFSGAQIDAAGNAEVETLQVRSWMKVRELIYNRLNAQEGDTLFSDSGTIEQLNEGPAGELQALMRSRWDGDFTPFQPGDIVYGFVNNLTDGGDAHRAWAWVRSVDRKANQLELVMYPDHEVPGRQNYPLTEGMTIARWGNNIEASAESYNNPEYGAVIGRRGDNYYNQRQRTFLISCDEGRIVELTGVNRPILEAKNYGTVLGTIPDGLLSEETAAVINREQPYLYARGILVQDLIRIGYDGMVVRTQNYRGSWDAVTASDPKNYYRTTSDTYDTVTWHGALWQSLASGSIEEPGDTSTAWLRMTGSTAETRGLWRIVPNTAQICVRKDGATIPEVLTCEVRRSSIDGDFTYRTGAELDAAGAEIWVSVDGSEMSRFVIGDPHKIQTIGGRWLVSRSGKTLRTQGDNMTTNGIQSEVVFELRDALTGERLDRATVAVVYDGEDGNTGPEGAAGPMVYPAGIWNELTTYSSTTGALPCVQHSGRFYVLQAGRTSRGNDPAKDYAANGKSAAWRLMESMQYVFADVLMANFAKLGAAVFYGDFMFSQDGTINGEPVSGLDANGVAYYTRFTDGKRAGTFIPNICVNFKSGYLGAAVGVFSGAIRTVFKPISESDAVRVTANQTAEPYITALKYELRSDVNLSTDRSGSVHVVLPVGEDCLGMRVILADSQGLFSHAPARITVSTADGSMIGGIASADIEANVGNYCARWVEVYGGMIELICIWSNPTGTDNRPGWAVVSHRGRGIIGIYRQSGLNLLTTEYWKNN